jgi:hypothetical protein
VTAWCSSGFLQVNTTAVLDVSLVLVVVAVLVLRIFLVLSRVNPLFCELLRKPDIIMGIMPFTEFSIMTHGKFHEPKLENINTCKPFGWKAHFQILHHTIALSEYVITKTIQMQHATWI